MELSFSQCRFTSFFKNFTKFLPLLALDEGDIEILKTYVSIFIRIGFYTTCNGDFTWHGLMLFSVLLSSQARLSSVYPWFRFSFLSFFLLVWQFMVMNFKQTKIKFKPQIKLNHYIASVNSICTQHTPPPGLRGGIWPPYGQSGCGAFANFALPEARAFANPRGHSRAFDTHAV